MRKIRFLIQTFSMVTTCVVFAVAVFTAGINPSEIVDAEIFWQIPLVSALCTLTSLIYPWDREMSKREVIVKTVIHYVLVNVVVLSSGAFFNWYDPSHFRNVCAMVLVIALIFGVVSIISWRKSAADAARMNERLEKYQETIE